MKVIGMLENNFSYFHENIIFLSFLERIKVFESMIKIEVTTFPRINNTHK